VSREKARRVMTTISLVVVLQQGVSGE